MGSSRNRTAGHKWELTNREYFRELGYHDLRSSREVSRHRDNCKVDLCNADEDANGRLPYNIQCKTLNSTAPYPKLIKELEEFNPSGRQINVVSHRMTKKAGKNFMPVGEYACLKLEDFRRMVGLIRGYEVILDHLGQSELEFVKKNRINRKHED